MVIRRNVTPVPVSKAILTQVESISDDEEMPTGLNTENRFGEVLYDNAWIAGVDDQDNDLDDSDYSTNEESDNEIH